MEITASLVEDAQKAERFLAHIKETTSFLEGKQSVHVMSHLDADGLTSTAILLTALERAGISYALDVVQNVDEAAIQTLNRSDESAVIFVDIGSGQLDLIVRDLRAKEVLILDHHEPACEELPESIIQANPHVFGLDGSAGISGAGVTYLFARELDEQNRDLAHLAIVGAIGDVQERDGFHQLNRLIHKEAEESGKLRTERGLTMYGAQTKPLTRVLAYNRDLELEGITGSLPAALSFLVSLGIEPISAGRERRLSDLSVEERQRLTSALLMKRSHLPDPAKIIGNTYTLVDEEEGTPFRCARELATLLNACGRMDAAVVGIRACMGDREMKRRALELESEYKRALSDAIRWYEGMRDTGQIESGKLIIIDGRDVVQASIIGTLASIVSHMDLTPRGALILSLARVENGDVKVSLRVKGDTELDLRALMHEIALAVGGAAGGHLNAAGALVPREHEERFLEEAERILRGALG